MSNQQSQKQETLFTGGDRHLVHTFTDSSTLASMSHDSVTEVLTLTFRNGRAYAYQAVPYASAVALRDAHSAGKHFSQNIRGLYVSSVL